MSWRWLPFPAAAVILAGSLLGGCSGVAGVWEGTMDCGTGGDVRLGFEVERDRGATYTGEGWASGLQYAGGGLSIDFEIAIETTRAAGAQELLVVLDDCVYEVAGYSSWGDVCGDDPQDVQWDGGDGMVGRLDDFLGAGMACDFDVERMD